MNRLVTKKFLLLIASFCITFHLVAQVEPLILYKAKQDQRCEEWVESMMARMSLKEKVGQLFIYTIAPQMNKPNQNLLESVVKTHKVGGLLFSGGNLRDQAQLMNTAQSQASIPLMMTFDGEWGLAMRLKETPSYPRNMVLGCIQDDRLIYEYGKEVARQLREMGVHVNFSPVADVNINPDNPVINTRSFGEDPVNVTDKVVAYSSGLESGGVLSVSKHFPGHGDTNVDSHYALPLLPFSRERLDSIELVPFKQVINAGLGSIMVGHLQIPALDQEGLPASLSPAIINGLLKEEIQFNGLVFTDALAMKGVADYKDVCLKALIAGNDMVLTPPNIKSQLQSVMDGLKSGVITEKMIEEKCRKVLRYKYALGVHNQTAINLSGLETRINSPAAEELNQKLRMSAITVLGNQDQALPFNPEVKELAILTIEGSQNASVFINELKKFANTTTIPLARQVNTSYIEDLKKRLSSYSYVVVAINQRDLKGYDSVLSELATEIPMIYASFVAIDKLDKIPNALSSSAAVVVAHSGERAIQSQVARVLFGQATADGRLSSSIPGAFKAGDGVTVSPDSPYHYSWSELGVNPDVLDEIDDIVNEGIKGGAFPGCQVYVMKKGQPIYNRSFGTFTYEKSAAAVQNNDLYDLASLSKTTGTLLAFMKIYDEGKVNITDDITDHLPFLKDSDKKGITISDLLFHQSGLPSSISFYRRALDEDSYPGSFVKGKRDAVHRVQIANNAFAPANFRFKEGLIASEPCEVYSMQVADDLWLNCSFREEELEQLVEAKVKEKKYVYSCVNFILLKEIIEHVTGQTLDAFLDKEFYYPMGLRNIGYLPLRYFSKDQIVPTVKGDYLRKTSSSLQGFVHDEAAAFFGGVSGNAGLFGSASDVGAVHQLWLNGGTYKGQRYLSEETCRLFTTATSKISRRGLGFDKPDAKNPSKSPCAESAPASVYGHTGFTGTCAWVDPDNELVYVFLCNRTYPNPWNRKLMSMNIRPRIQEVLYKAMKNA